MKNKKLGIVLLIITLLFLTITNVYADDYPDDIYDGDYSLQDMLSNYNIITFGKKDLDSQMPQIDFSKGKAKIFHINSSFLINGNVQVERLDLNGNNYLKSYCNKINTNIYCGYDNSTASTSEIKNCKISNYEIVQDNIYTRTASSIQVGGWYSPFNTTIGNYMNFDRLYDSITTEQNKIKKGRYITGEDGVAHIETGGEYYIDDMNDISDIIFDNFENNHDDLTIITINNTGSINFPKIYKGEENGEKSLVPTNDFIRMERPNSSYANYYVIDQYYGNIIWNIPNATYIKLPSAPFIGHLVAPNADLYGPELHYAGAFLVNSLYLEGNSEAHYYPLTKIIPYRNNTENYKATPMINENQGSIIFNNDVDNELLEEGMIVSFRVEAKNNDILTGIEIKDEEENMIEFRKVGDNEYEFTMPATNVIITPQFKEKNIKNTIEQIITNPKTRNNFILVLGIIIVSFIVVYKGMRKEKKS